MRHASDVDLPVRLDPDRREIRQVARGGGGGGGSGSALVEQVKAQLPEFVRLA
ncbi:hypothetical protein AB0I68_21770 [Streptomyces sp. NPDC050448]|uniref:hypothetical protein n=1 Tax=Streptomyces sp. NPDC050448 TaxID=3155404 RepID=UPI003412221E